jgi:hypothetical protein
MRTAYCVLRKERIHGLTQRLYHVPLCVFAAHLRLSAVQAQVQVLREASVAVGEDARYPASSFQRTAESRQQRNTMLL